MLVIGDGDSEYEIPVHKAMAPKNLRLWGPPKHSLVSICLLI